MATRFPNRKRWFSESRAVELAEAGALASSDAIMVRSVAGDKYDRMVCYRPGPLPEPVFCEPSFDEEEVPF